MQDPREPGAGVAGASSVLLGGIDTTPHSDPSPDFQPALRPYQHDIIGRLNAAIAAGIRRILLVAPTGSGKTVIATSHVGEAVQRHERALFMVHRRELVKQSSAKLYDLGVDHGILLPGFPVRLHEPVQVASVATLHARAIRSNKIELPPANLVLVDEAHHVCARTWMKILERYPNAIVIGLTATPVRGDGRGLGSVFAVIIECPSVQELIDLGFLVPTKFGKPAKRAGRDIAEAMSAEQKRAAVHREQQQREEAQQQRLADRTARQERLAQIEAQKPARKALPDICDVVLELLPNAIEIESASGLMFNTRRLLYRIRDEVQRRSGKELVQSYFDKLITEIEAEQGDLSPLLIREARGSFSIPHDPAGATPLGTLAVRNFHRPAWRFNKIIAIEKDDLRLMLEQAGWDERHDALLVSAKGFNTRAARDLIDKVAETTEPVKAFSVHDGDWAGTLIQHTLQNATLARAARKIEIIDLGLQPWEGVALGLPVERVTVRLTKSGEPTRRPVGEYVRAATSRAPNGQTWEQWLQYSRVELNAFTSAELIDWLDHKMAEVGVGKVIPPNNILRDEFSEQLRAQIQEAVAEAIEQRLADQIAAIEAERAEATKDIQAEIDRITADLRRRLAEVSEPFQQRIETARLEANAIDRDGNSLRMAISEAFSDRPMLPWLSVLREIADAVEADIDDTVQSFVGDGQ